jgi:hypothetical protein
VFSTGLCGIIFALLNPFPRGAVTHSFWTGSRSNPSPSSA